MIGLKRMWKNIIIAVLPIMLMPSLTSCSLIQKELTNEDVMTSKHTCAARLDSHTFLNHSGIIIGWDGIQFDTRDNAHTTPYDGEYISIAGIVEQTLEDSIIVKIESELYGVEYSANITVYPIITDHIEAFSKDDIIWITGLYSYSNLSISDAILNRDDIFGRSYSKCISEAIEIDKQEFFYDEKEYSIDDRIRLNKVFVGVVDPTYCIVWCDEVDTDSIFLAILDTVAKDNRGFGVYFTDSDVYSQIKPGDWIDISGIVYNDDFWGKSLKFANLLNTSSHDFNSEKETAVQTMNPQPSPSDKPNDNSLTQTPASEAEQFSPIDRNAGNYDDIAGTYIDEYGSGLYMFIGYEDASKQTAYANAILAMEDILVKLERNGNSISGNDYYRSYGSSPSQIVDMIYNPLDGSITATIYADTIPDGDTIRFVPYPNAPYSNPFYVD